MSLLPSKPDTSAAEEAEPRVVGVESDAADDLLAALSSDTARQVLSELHDEPAPPAELADRVDTSLQNAQYHLENLQEAGAVEVVDTVYSEKGREMDVYAPADRPLVIFAGDEDSTSSIRTALSRLLGGLGILGLASLVVQGFATGTVRELLPGAGTTGDGDDAATGGDGGAAGDGGADGADGGAADGADGGGDGAAETTSEAAAARTETPASTEEAETARIAGGDGGGAAETATPPPEATATPTSGDIGIASTPQPTGTPASSPTVAAPDTAAPTAEPASPTPTGVETETAAATPTPDPATASATDTATATEVATTATEGGVEAAAAGLPPGLVFFLGGATVLVGGFVLWYLRE